jgi:hypothetical protein
MQFLQLGVKILRTLIKGAKFASRTLWNFRVGFIIIAVFAGLASIVHFLLPLHYRQVGWGTFLFIVGSTISLATESWKERKWLKWLRPIFIPIFLAAGALLTTQGWNIINDYKRDQALAVKVANEWKLNDLRNVIIEDAANYIKNNDYHIGHLFDLPTHVQISSALEIGEIEYSSFENSTFKIALFDYVIHIDKLCLCLNLINKGFNEPFSFSAFTGTVKQTFGDGGTYQKYKEQHRLVGELLRKNYPGILEKMDHIIYKIEPEKKQSANNTSVTNSDPNKQIEPNNTN